MDPYEIENSGITFYGEESEYVLAESNDPDDQRRMTPREVIALRDWLNAWLDTHVFVVSPRV